MNTVSIHVDQIPFFLCSNQKQIHSCEKNNNALQTSFCVIYDDSCKNVIRISQIIQKINKYQDYFWIPEKVENVELKTPHESKPNQYNSHVLLTYPENQVEEISFSAFLLQNKSTRHFLFYLQDSYRILLQSLKKLEDHHICYFGMESKKIVFRQSMPILKDFHSSFHTHDANRTKKIMQIIELLNNFSYQPLEVHTLYYLVKNKSQTLSYSQIVEISAHYVKSMPIFSLFDELYRKKYEEKCVECLKKYVNQDQSYIVDELTSSFKSWDQYALTVLYLHLVGKAINQYSLKNTFLNGWIKMLIKQLNPEPGERYDLENSMKKFEDLYETYPHWTFVKSINKINQNQVNL